jgi:rare lipoprotein A
MQTSQVSKRLRKQARGLWRSRRRRLALAAGILLLLGSLGIAGALLHQRQQAALNADDGEIAMEVDAGGNWQRPQPPPALPPPPDKEARVEAQRADAAAQAKTVGPAREVKAAWYDVPNDSLAKRRAGAEELTAAHNRLPIGTLVRVTNLSNGRSTLVRITDRGIRDKRIKLDVCREAAEELGMVSKGIARVKMEVVREELEGSSPPGDSSAALP